MANTRLRYVLGKNLIRTRKPDGSITVELSEGVSATRAPNSFALDAHTVSEGARRRKLFGHDPIVAVPPGGSSETITVAGLLREIRKHVDVERDLGLGGSTPISSAFLGPLAKGEWGKITVHEPSASGNVLHSYTAFVPSQSIRDSKSAKGVTVLVELETLNIPRMVHAWYSVHYEVLG